MSDGISAVARTERLARYYDLDFLDVSYDAELYLQLAREASGPVLELGVGSGRLAIPLALAGHEVVGIDADAAMLERAGAAWIDARGRLDPGRLTLAEADFRSFRAEPRFGLALIAVNTFLLAEDDDARLAILGTMRANLRGGGLAAIEVGTPDERELARYDRRLQHEWLRIDPATGDEVTKSISANHDAETATVELTQIYEWTPAHGGPMARVVKTDFLHLISAERLGDLARQAGFDQVDVWGDHLSIPHDVGSHRAICVARLV